MRSKYVVLIVALGAIGLAASGYYYWITHRPWTTESPRIQNGLELVSIQRVPDGEKPRISPEFNPDAMMVSLEKGPIEIALFRVPEKNKVDMDPDLRPKKGNLAFYLTSKNEKYTTKLHVKDYGSDCSVVGVVMQDVCPPAYHDGSLVAKIGEKVLGEWKLSRIRLAPKLIPDSAQNLEVVEFGRLKVQAKANLWLYGGNHSWLSLSFGTIEKPTDGDQYEAIIERCNTTYRSLGIGGGLPFGYKHGLWGSTPLGTDAASKRVEVVAKLIRYRTYDEHVSVKKVHIEPLMMGDKVPSVFLATFGGEQRFQTPSGLKLTVVEAGNPIDNHTRVYFNHSFGLRIRSEGGLANLNLPNSPLGRATGKPLSISYSCDNLENTGPMYSPSEDGKTLDLQFQIPYSQNKAQDIADLKLSVRQKAVLEEKTVRFILPIERQRPVAIEGKSPAKPKNRT